MQTVLIIDDNVETVEILKLRLINANFKVIAFTNCVEAMEFVAEQPEAFDCVISDLNMPDATGLDLLSALREIDAETPFFIITAQTEFDEGIVSEGGGQGVLYKPLNLEALIERVRWALREFRQR